MRSRILCFCFLIFCHVPGHCDDKSIKDFVDGAGSFLYGLAWPTATYERTSFKGVFKQGNDRIARITLHGRSGFTDGHLWVDVDVIFRNGALYDIRWGNHNALLMPPGKTVEAMGEVLQEMAEEYERQKQLKSGTTTQARYALAAIYNQTDITIQFQYLWASSTWKDATVKPGSYFWFWDEYPVGRQSSPNLTIRYDWTLYDEAYVRKAYSLSRLAAPAKDVSYAKSYQFLKKGSYLKVFEK